MNIDDKEIYAATSANSCGRCSIVRALAVACLLAGTAASAAIAGDRDRDSPRAGQVQGPPAPRDTRPMAPQRQGDMRADTRQFDPRAFDMRADEQRRQLQMQQEQNAHNADVSRRSGRLTPDERRDLRRQINEAGIDLYPNTPRR